MKMVFVLYNGYGVKLNTSITVKYVKYTRKCRDSLKALRH